MHDVDLAPLMQYMGPAAVAEERRKNAVRSILFVDTPGSEGMRAVQAVQKHSYHATTGRACSCLFQCHRRGHYNRLMNTVSAHSVNGWSKKY